MNKVIGVGKVVNGRVMYVGSHGGYSKPVYKAPSIEAPVEKAPIMEEPAVEKASQEVDLVFDFIHGRKHKPKNNVIHVDFGKSPFKEVR